MSSARDGVLFDIVGFGKRSLVAWPKAGSSNAWLALDRNGNGVIDNVTELFGNRTEQPQPPPGTARNGFLALAVFDRSAEGGNGDGAIDSSDLVFSKLRLWRDVNRNGKSEVNELKTLSELMIDKIDLEHMLSIRIDKYVNRYVFRSKIYGSHKSGLARWCWDVVPLSLPAATQ